MIRKRKAHQKNHSVLPKLAGVVLILVLTVVIVFWPKYWNGKSKLAVVINRGEEGAMVSLFDPKQDEITNLFITGQTQVLAAGGFGPWKIKSLWQLGINEKIGGALLARTIAKNFGFPVAVWADGLGLGYQKTNLTLGDRARLSLFSLRVKKSDIEDIRLEETGMLKKSRFIDGEDGFLPTGEISAKIAAIFVSNQTTDQSLKAKIIDGSEKKNASPMVGKIIEVMGLKVAAIVQEGERIEGCFVSGNNPRLIEEIALIFGCKAEKKTLEGSFDVEIKIGEDFVNRF